MIALRERFRIGSLQSQQGAALIIAVMILLILTVLGIYAITTSTLETKIAGNERVLKDAFYAADGGIDYGRHVIALVFTNSSLLGTSPHDAENGTTLQQEIIGDSTSGWQSTADSNSNGIEDGSPWVAPTIGNSSMAIHVDRIKAEEPPGYSGEFGAPVAEKQTLIYYAVDSVSTGIAGASSEIQATYRHVLHY
jgi:Tfp pilus assembly protein PilX